MIYFDALMSLRVTVTRESSKGNHFGVTAGGIHLSIAGYYWFTVTVDSEQRMLCVSAATLHFVKLNS